MDFVKAFPPWRHQNSPSAAHRARRRPLRGGLALLYAALGLMIAPEFAPEPRNRTAEEEALRLRPAARNASSPPTGTGGGDPPANRSKAARPKPWEADVALPIIPEFKIERWKDTWTLRGRVKKDSHRGELQ